MLNLIVASTNWYGLIGVVKAYEQQNYIHASLLSSVITFSTLYHLVEKSKHSMRPLFKVNEKVEHWLLQADRLFAVLSVLSSLYLIYIKSISLSLVVPKFLYGAMCALIADLFSSCCNKHHNSLLSCYFYMSDAPSPKWLERSFYAICHSIWHLCAFHVSNLIVNY
jgi:hypothetical protein